MTTGPSSGIAAIQPPPNIVDTAKRFPTVSPADLAGLLLELSGEWVSGARRYPNLGQLNLEWYRRVLQLAGVSNPSRDDLKYYFNLPHGTAQYLASALYNPTALPLPNDVQAIEGALKAEMAVMGITKIATTGVQFNLSPRLGKVLRALVESEQRHAIVARPSPSIKSQIGVDVVAAKQGDGAEVLCRALVDPSDPARAVTVTPTSCHCGHRP